MLEDCEDQPGRPGLGLTHTENENVDQFGYGIQIGDHFIALMISVTYINAHSVVGTKLS